MTDIKDEIRGRLTEYVESITTPANNHGFYKCPLCGSGARDSRNSDGAFSIDPKTGGTTWKCFSCDQGGDIFTLIGLHEDIPDFMGQYDRACRIFDVGPFKPSEGKDTRTTPNVAQTAPLGPSRARMKKHEPQGTPEGKAKTIREITTAKGRIQQTDYFTKRGFTSETVERFGLGYDPLFNMQGQTMPAVIMPYGEGVPYYMARSTTGKKFTKPLTEDVGAEPVFNIGDLFSGEPCFVCEAPIDAMSIIQAGGHAVATGGTAHSNLVAALKGHERLNEPLSILILAFDEDAPGREATARLSKELDNLKIVYVVAEWKQEAYPDGRRKDVNDRLLGNIGQLKADISANVAKARQEPGRRQEMKMEAIAIDNGTNRLRVLMAEIEANKHKTLYTPTGFPQLDKELDGGLYPGLYTLGAISSLGKTTFALQIGDNIAKSGRDVLIFSLEMPASELIAKSISRLTYLGSDKDNSEGIPKTGRGITTASRYPMYTEEEIDAINKACKSYTEYGDRIFIKEGVGNFSIYEITQAIEEHHKTTGRAPVVIVDYLQIIAPETELMRASDKQITDKAVLELKRISRDYNTPVLAISSFNRDNYAEAVSMSAFKESGAIEYGSDVLLALQPKDMDHTGDAKGKKAANKERVDNCKASTEREIEAVILKNRNGSTGGKIQFRYYAMFNYFEEYDKYAESWKEYKREKQAPIR